MHDPTPEAPIDLPGRIRREWAEGRGEGALRLVLADGPPEDGSVLAEVLTADAEERWERGRSATVETYLPLVPELTSRREACRSLLLCELAWREDRDDPGLADRLRERLPELRDEIDVVVGFFREFSGSGRERDAIHTGERLGRYELRAALGRGSFGEVWRAWDTALERHVALKLLPAPQDGGADAVLEEARAAAALDHPNIVRVHDAGTFPDANLLYIDAQLVAEAAPLDDGPDSVRVGRPLEEIAVGEGAQPFPPRRAAEVVETVCRAVAAAHARGVTHGDLKPGNILMSPSGAPMVADFGLAVFAPAADRVESATHSVCIRTSRGRITGTPAYMSPEQARAERPTPLSDVYSLGATLVAVLTGRPPFRPAPDAISPARDVIEQVRSAPPDLSAVEAVEPTLAAICAKATRADPAERYLSAAQLADDLRAWLERRPTLARPRGAAGRAGLWARRNRRLLVPSAALGLAMAGLSGWYVVSLQRAEARAASEAAKYGAVSGFLTDMLESSDPSRAQGRDVTLREKLDEAAARLRADPPASPEVALALHRVVGGTYAALALYDEAEPHVRQALAIARALHEGDHPAIAEALQRAGRLRAAQGRGAEALEAYDEALAMRERLHGRDSVEFADVEHERAGHLLTTGRYREAAPALEHAYAVLRGRLPAGDKRRPLVSNTYAGLLDALGRPDEAAEAFGEAARGLGETLGPLHTSTLIARANRAVMLGRTGRVEESEREFRAVLADAEAVVGPGHVVTINAMNGLARLLERADRHAEAEPIFREALARAEAGLSPTSAHVLELRNNLAQNLRNLGRIGEALPLFRESYDAHLRAYGEDSLFTAMARGGLAQGLMAQGDPELDAEAAALFARSLETFTSELPPGHPMTVGTLRSLATLYGPDRLDEPEALDVVAARLPPEP